MSLSHGPGGNETGAWVFATRRAAAAAMAMSLGDLSAVLTLGRAGR